MAKKTDRTKDKVHIYRSRRNDQFGWFRRAANGEKVSASGETYIKHAHAIKMATEVNPGLVIVDIDPKEKHKL